MQKPFLSREQRLRREFFWSLALLVAGLVLGLISPDISDGVLPAWCTRYLLPGHDQFICPLCGGVRSFAYVCRLQVCTAAHFSLLGTCGSLYMLCTLPLRGLLLVHPSAPKLLKIHDVLDRFETTEHFLLAMALFFFLQLGLHAMGAFTWIPLEQFMVLDAVP